MVAVCFVEGWEFGSVCRVLKLEYGERTYVVVLWYLLRDDFELRCVLLPLTKGNSWIDQLCLLNRKAHVQNFCASTSSKFVLTELMTDLSQ